MDGAHHATGGGAYRQAVILVGGEGTRLRPITSRIPKPTAPVMGRPFVSFILENLVRHGIERVVFSTGYLAAAIEAEVGDGSSYGLEARYVREDSPLGTAGAVKNAESELEPGGFFVFNGDVLTDIDLTALAAFHREKRATATIVTTLVEDPRRYGLVELNAENRVSSFVEKPGDDHAEPGLINAGVYVLEHDVLAMIPGGVQLSIEHSIFPALAALGKLYSYVGRGYWRDIGTPQSYLEAHFDILRDSLFGTERANGGSAALWVSTGADVDPDASIVPPALIQRGASIGPKAQVGPWAVVGRGARVGPGARVVAAVLQEEVELGSDVVVERSVIVRQTTIGSGSRLTDVVIGEACDIGEGNVLANGLQLFPQAVLTDRSVIFRLAEGGRLAVPSPELAQLKETA